MMWKDDRIDLGETRTIGQSWRKSLIVVGLKAAKTRRNVPATTMIID